MIKFFILFATLGFYELSAKPITLIEYFNDNSQDKTFKEFPFKQYSDNLEFSTFKNDLVFLKENKIDDWFFFENVLNTYFEKNKMNKSVSFLLLSYRNSEMFKDVYKSDSSKYFSFSIIQNMFLSDIAQKLQSEINNNKIDSNDEEVEALILNLSKYKYFITIRKSNLQKIIYHIKNRNFKYLIKKATGTYLNHTIMLVCIILVVGLLIKTTIYFLKTYKII